MSHLPGPFSPNGGRGNELPPRPSKSGIVRVVLTLTVALGSVLALTDASFALWNVSAPIASTTVVSGTLTATVAEGGVPSPTATSATFAPSTWSGMLPGESRQSAFTVANTGSAPFEVAASLDDAAANDPNVHFAVGVAPCAPDGTGLHPLSSSPVQVGPTQSTSQAVTFCLSVTLDPGVDASMQDASVLDGFTLSLTANQAIQ